jgi:hypothetical protein
MDRAAKTRPSAAPVALGNESGSRRWCGFTERREMNFEWMDGSVKPSRPGVYPVKDAHGTAARYFARWTGTVWNVACASQARAMLVNAESKYQNRQWRRWATDMAA